MTTKDEIKNRISMALQSPILQQGFEIICRENDELEKKNAELKERADKSDLDSVLFFNQLCKAKEIIINLLRTLKNENSDFTFALKYTHPVLREAEQFLKEVDE